MCDAQSLPSTRSFVEKHQRRYTERPIELKRYKSGIQKQSSNAALLATMNRDKLVSLLQGLLEGHPELRQDIMTYIPAPTIASATSVLQDMEKLLADSFPYSRHGPGRDAYTFSRVREPMRELIDTVTQYANHFTSAIVFPTTCFSFLDLATHIAQRLPVWDNEEHNTMRRNLYRDLAGFWLNAVRSAAAKLQEGESYSTHTVSDWAKNLAQHNGYTNGLFTDAVHEFSRLLFSSPTSEKPCTSLYHHPGLVDKDLSRFGPQSPVVGYADV
ncbi:Cut8 six-helix bundle-domain-containing protein [Phycomyces nitens]|nr:Cut8 six-helix bundle-domain-containing protein [Phycomyces nitens]